MKTFVWLLVLFALAGSVYAQSVVLVSDNEADRAFAEALVSVKGLQLVTTPWGKFDASVVEKIKASNPGTIFILGGTAAVPSEYETALNFTTLIRIAGRDRAQTAAMALEHFKSDFKGKGIVIAYGYDSRGIKTALEKARKLGGVVLYVKDELSEDAEKALSSVNASSAEMVLPPNVNQTRIEKKLKERVKEVKAEKVNSSQKALEQINEAKEELAKAEKKIAELNLTRSAAVARLINLTKQHLQNAEAAFNQSNYGEAFGQAVAAEHNAENAKRIAEKLEELGAKDKDTRETRVAKELDKMQKKLSELEIKIQREEGKGRNASEAKSYLTPARAALANASSALQQGDAAAAMAEIEKVENFIALAKLSLEMGETGKRAAVIKFEDESEKGNKQEKEEKDRSKGK